MENNYKLQDLPQLSVRTCRTLCYSLSWLTAQVYYQLQTLQLNDNNFQILSVHTLKKRTKWFIYKCCILQAVRPFIVSWWNLKSSSSSRWTQGLQAMWNADFSSLGLSTTQGLCNCPWLAWTTWQTRNSWSNPHMRTCHRRCLARAQIPSGRAWPCVG